MAEDTLLGGQLDTDSAQDGNQPEVEQQSTSDTATTEETASIPAPTAPEQYDFSEAVGDQLDAETAASFSDVLKSVGATQEQASAIAKYGVGYAQQIANQAVQYQEEQAAKQSQEWADATRKELGASFDDTIAQCGTAVEYLERVVPNIREILNENGLGNRVEVVRAFAKIGQLVSEDRGHDTNGLGSAQTAADILYGGNK